MTDLWQLPDTWQAGERVYTLHPDYRDILEVIAYLEDPDLPEFLRWQIALALFYEEQVLPEHQQQAMEYLALFLNGGCPQTQAAGPKLLDWQQDALSIIADVNKVSGREIRAMPFLHWWTFLAWFHAIGEGQLSTLVSIRDKLHRGKKLEGWEKDFYRNNKERLELKKRYSAEELARQAALQQLLDG